MPRSTRRTLLRTQLRTPLRTLLLAVVVVAAAAFHVPPAAAPQPVAEEIMIDRRFDLPSGARFLARLADADVVVQRGDAGAAHVQVILHADDLDRARAYFERQRFRVEQDGAAVRVTTDPEREPMLSWTGLNNLRIVVRAVLPEAIDADIRTADGDVTLASLRGALNVATADGDVAAERLADGPLTIRTADGDVSVRSIDAPGDRVEVRTADGSIALDDLAAAESEVRTADGDIRIERLRGSAFVRTSDGSIRIGRASGDDLTVQTSDGDVVVDALTARRAQVRSSDGDLVLRSVDAELDAATSEGDVSVRLLKPAAVSLRTSDGDVAVTVPARYPADVRLRGDDVRMGADVEAAFLGRTEDESATGALNGGGPPLDVRTGDGTVYLRTDVEME